ncbi:Rossmann-fold NAD(P)-binding domain-containing protein [Streptomyces olivaceus]|uniref:hypothetical protein n=1 Tax=Streptomyces olivaceus TaxID=47716 RepID=UPI0036325538
MYELGGDESFTLTDLAAAISAAAGKQVAYADLPVADLAQVLSAAGLPAELAEVLADADRGMNRGEMYTDSGDLRRLIGRPPATLVDALAVALRSRGWKRTPRAVLHGDVPGAPPVLSLGAVRWWPEEYERPGAVRAPGLFGERRAGTGCRVARRVVVSGTDGGGRGRRHG